MNEATPSSTPLLAVRGLEKRFGGVVATDRVDLDVERGTVHALIGPNGAGKTTLVAQIGGQLASDHGRIAFEGDDITTLPAHGRARRGLARSFQVTRLFRSASVLDNVALAVLAVSPASMGAWRPFRRDGGLFARARQALDDVDLGAKAAQPIDRLSHGERRALEVAMTLASRPRLMLLDEPMAGLGAEESARMERLVDRLRATTTVLLIEHDVGAVFRLADRVSVLVGGRVIATGAPAAVRSNPAVIAAYLGDEAA
ncbi:MAG TPA: ABC transporter ATP-binding protein [Caldimonas sp.]|jgi:branched-chain amino acid transport system ATP-binding protein